MQRMSAARARPGVMGHLTSRVSAPRAAARTLLLIQKKFVASSSAACVHVHSAGHDTPMELKYKIMFVSPANQSMNP